MATLQPRNRHPAIHSPAHLARAAFAFEEFAALRDLSLGKLVSTLARCGSLESLLPPLEPPR